MSEVPGWDDLAHQMAVALAERGYVPAPDACPEWQTDLDTMSVRLTIRTVPVGRVVAPQACEVAPGRDGESQAGSYVTEIRLRRQSGDSS